MSLKEERELKEAIYSVEGWIQGLERKLRAADALGLDENNVFVVGWFFELEDRQIQLQKLQEQLWKLESSSYEASITSDYNDWRNS